MELRLEIEQVVGFCLHVSRCLSNIFHLCLRAWFYVISSDLSFSLLFSLYLCLFSCLLCPLNFKFKVFSSSLVNIFQICMMNLDCFFLSSHTINTLFISINIVSVVYCVIVPKSAVFYEFDSPLCCLG